MRNVEVLLIYSQFYRVPLSMAVSMEYHGTQIFFYFRAMCDKVRVESSINLSRSKMIYLKREIRDGYGGHRSLSVIPRAISRR